MLAVSFLSYHLTLATPIPSGEKVTIPAGEKTVKENTVLSDYGNNRPPSGNRSKCPVHLQGTYNVDGVQRQTLHKQIKPSSLIGTVGGW